MSRIPVTCLLYLILLFFSYLPGEATAQRSLGVLWDVPATSSQATEELFRFNELNITYLEVQEIVSDEIWEEIRKRNFKVFVQIPVYYPVYQTFAEADSALVDRYQQYLEGYAGRNIAGIGAFAYGATHRQAFNEAVAPFARQLNSGLPVDIYFKDWNLALQPADSMFDFTMTSVDVDQEFLSRDPAMFTGSRAFIYQPVKELSQKVAPLKWFFEKTGVNKDAILFFGDAWLLNFLNQHRTTGKIIAEHAVYQDAVFPLPSENIRKNNPHSPIVLILITVWGLLALSYNIVPMYRHSLFRFFFSHQFFIEDVMKRHIRTIFPSMLILIQHALLGGIFLYSLVYAFVANEGLQVFYSYLPSLTIFGTGYFSFFLIGSSVILLFELVSVLWLYAANRRIGYLSQVSILYSWPFHINLVVTTIILTMLMAGANSYLISIFFVLFLGVLLIDFPITAYDTGKKITKGKVLYMLSTLGLYTLLLIGGIIALYYSSYLLNILDLAITIS